MSRFNPALYSEGEAWRCGFDLMPRVSTARTWLAVSRDDSTCAVELVRQEKSSRCTPPVGVLSTYAGVSFAINDASLSSMSEGSGDCVQLDWGPRYSDVYRCP